MHIASYFFSSKPQKTPPLIALILLFLLSNFSVANAQEDNSDLEKTQTSDSLVISEGEVTKTPTEGVNNDCDKNTCIDPLELEAIYKPRATNTVYNGFASPYDLSENPYQVSLFSAEHGENSERLWSQTKGIFSYGFIIITAIALLPEDVSNWERGEIFGKWGDNVKEGPVWDRDGLVLNVFGHGYFGGAYYQVARKSGYRQWDAFLYSTLMSTFYWEYGIEAFAEVPSIQDLVLTPVLGWAYGEWAYQSEQEILRDGGQVWGSDTLGSISMALLDPIDSLSVGINNMFGSEIFIAGTGYLDMKDVAINNNGDTESYVGVGVTYQFGDGTTHNKTLNHKAAMKSYKDPVSTSIIGVSTGYGNMSLDEIWEIEGGNYNSYSLGLYFSKSFSARLLYDRGDMLIKGTNDTKRYENYSINGQYYFNTEHNFRPYVTAGFGEMMRDKDTEKTTFQTHYGAGLHYQLTGNLALQGDGRYYYSTSANTSEVGYSAGLIYRFGSGENY